ncbi:rho family-interacting cell polarization regulator 2 isoform X2 [Engraulis encrasicolus]
MAAGTHSPGGPNGIIRSQSFAGFSTLQERRSRCNSFMGNSVIQKKPSSKAKKPHASAKSSSSSSSSRDPQPKRVEEVYSALKQGLDEYLEVHQTELDKLTSLMKDMKRNSRLGVLYDLDKQIKTIERYMRRLEFHISKVDELFEGFCIQSRLREGASKMKQAFTASPSTKSTRESLAEVNRRYKEYTENMSTFEAELENLLGEFHIKMRGLAGFARLCPGDQYEIFMRYGRQRWKLKGRIEANSRQSWDGEEMVFMPLITDLISIKVTELKGLATHVLVGSVICETKDLFTAMPQVVAVDVNDLGTIKLNLEVTWYPFDVEDLTLSSGNVSKATALQRRVSVYSQGTPETPTFQDTSFFSTLPDDVFENGGCGGVAECKRLSFTFSDTPVSTPTTTSSQSNPEITVTPPETDPPPQISLDEEEEELEDEENRKREDVEDGGQGQAVARVTEEEEIEVEEDEDLEEEEDEEEEEEEEEATSGSVCASDVDSEWDRRTDNSSMHRHSGSASGAPSLCSGESSQLSASVVGPEDVLFLESGSGSEVAIAISPPDVIPNPDVPDIPDDVSDIPDGIPNIPDGIPGGIPDIPDGIPGRILDIPDGIADAEGSELKPVELELEGGSLTRQLVRRLTSSEVLPEGGALSWAGEGSRAFLESSLEEAIQTLLLRLEAIPQRCRELQDLEQEVMRLEDLLKCRLPAQRSRSSSLSLTVESALESFDFLNTSDFDDDDTGDDVTAAGAHPLPRTAFFDEPDRTGSTSPPPALSRVCGPGQHPEARGHLSEALTEDTGVGNSVAGSPLPLTTGNENLDVAIVIHLQYCNHLVQLVSGGGAVGGQRRAHLRKLSAQTQLLEDLSDLSTERLASISTAVDVLPGLAEKPSLLSLWSECSGGSGGLFHTTLDRVLTHLQRNYAHTLQDTLPISADTVIRLVVSEMVDRVELASPPACGSASALAQDILTVFQFHSYASENRLEDMQQHLQNLAKEVVLADVLSSGEEEGERLVCELEQVCVSTLCPRAATLRATAALLVSEETHLSKAAISFLTAAAQHTHFRSKAVEFYTQALSEVGVNTQKAACAALTCLQASESISAVVSLCDSADEDLRHLAIETLLTFGEEGRLAYEQLDTVPREMIRLGTRRGNAITTAF